MPTAMIVDDNTTLVYFTAWNLEQGIPGLEVITAASCEEARAVVKKRIPSVLISDIKLADGNGIDLVDEMLDRHPHMPAILISGVPPMSPLRDDLFGFLLKPYEAEELVELVRMALAQNAPSEKTLGQLPQVEQERCKGYDRHKLCNRLAELVAGLRAFGMDIRDRSGDPEAVRRTVDTYLDQLCSTAMEVSRELPRCPLKQERKSVEG